MMKQPELGQKILELRQLKGMTQEELVEQCNISVRTIQRIEAGETTPRMYTVKTILDALGYDLQLLKEDASKAGAELKHLIFPSKGKDKQHTIVQLRWSWIAGILFFLVSTPELIHELYYYATDEYLFGTNLFVLLKLLNIVSYFFFMRGLMVVGQLFGNPILKIGALLMLIFGIGFYAFDVLDRLVLSTDMEVILIIKSMVLGLGGVLLGIGLTTLKQPIKMLGLVAGILEICAGACFFLVFLGPVGLVFWSAAIIVEVVLLYKLVQLIATGEA